MKILLVALLVLNSICCIPQNPIKGTIWEIGSIVNKHNLSDTYVFYYVDSVKFKQPYVTNGKSVGAMVVKNFNDRHCRFMYYIIEFTNKDSISHQLFRYYSLSETSSAISSQTYFYFDNYVFFMSWCCPYSDPLCDYIPRKIHDDIEKYLKNNEYHIEIKNRLERNKQ